MKTFKFRAGKVAEIATSEELFGKGFIDKVTPVFYITIKDDESKEDPTVVMLTRASAKRFINAIKAVTGVK